MHLMERLAGFTKQSYVGPVTTWRKTVIAALIWRTSQFNDW